MNAKAPGKQGTKSKAVDSFDDVEAILKDLEGISLLQATVFRALHQHRQTIAEVAARNRLSINRVEAEHKAACMTIITMVSNGRIDQWGDAYAEATQAKSKAAAAVGQTMTRGAGPSDA